MAFAAFLILLLLAVFALAAAIIDYHKLREPKGVPLVLAWLAAMVLCAFLAVVCLIPPPVVRNPPPALKE